MVKCGSAGVFFVSEGVGTAGIPGMLLVGRDKAPMGRRGGSPLVGRSGHVRISIILGGKYFWCLGFENPRDCNSTPTRFKTRLDTLARCAARGRKNTESSCISVRTPVYVNDKTDC